MLTLKEYHDFSSLELKSLKSCLSKQRRDSGVFFLSFLVDSCSIWEAEIDERNKNPKEVVFFERGGIIGEVNLAGSSNGRIRDSESRHLGSNPSPATPILQTE